MSQLTFDARKILEDDFPVTKSTAEKIKFLLNYAVLAPSGHNTQPWIFKIVDDVVELYVDKTRALPVADPNYRELIISCGAALFHLRIAMRHFGHRDIVEILPEHLNPNLLARIRLGSKRIVQVEENFLFWAISQRCTNHRPLENCRLPASLISELKSATSSEGDWLQISTQIIPEASREEIVNLIDRGDRLQMSNPLFRQELAHWIYHSRSSHHEGLTLETQGINPRLEAMPSASFAIAPLFSLVTRSFDLGKSQANKNRKLVETAPLLILISSNDDTPQDWLATGEALAHLLLRARIDNVCASCFNQPIEIPQLRSRLQALFPENGYPQILLRLGYAKDTKQCTSERPKGLVRA